MEKFYSFPEAVYCAHFSHNYYQWTAALVIDARSFVDVESFILGNLPPGWECVTIEKTYAYAKMFAGDNGESIDFSFAHGRTEGVTHHVDELGDGDIESKSWAEIIGLALDRQLKLAGKV